MICGRCDGKGGWFGTTCPVCMGAKQVKPTAEDFLALVREHWDMGRFRSPEDCFDWLRSHLRKTTAIIALALLAGACTQGDPHEQVPSQIYQDCHASRPRYAVGLRRLCRGADGRSNPARGDRPSGEADGDHLRAPGAAGAAAGKQGAAQLARRATEGGVIYGVKIELPTGRVYLRSGRSAPGWCAGETFLIAEAWVDPETEWELLQAQRDASLIVRTECH